MDSLNIHGSFENNKHIIPSNIEIIEHTYNGNPFSHFYTLKTDTKALDVHFGTGGYYPHKAQEIIEDYFN